MKRLAFISIVTLVLLAMPTTGGSRVDAGAPSADVISLSSEQELARELALVAEGHGWTVAEAAARHRTAEIIGGIAEQIFKERPDIFVGSALSEYPTGAPTLYVKGTADAFVRSLVDTSGIKIVLADNQPFSFDELEERKIRVHHAFEAQGFRNVATGANIAGGGRIPAEVTIEPGLSSSPEEMLSALPADLRSSVDLTITDIPVGMDTTSFGGMLVTVNGAGNSTSGWSVIRLADGVTGVTTAGHAPNAGSNGIVHPGHAEQHTFNFQAEHRGDWGDIQWHTTNFAEVDDYYSTATTIADVVSVEARANISVGEGVCQYGRFSNSQDCSLDVFDVSEACTIDGVFNNRLVLMNGKTTALGDSGGPWFSAGRAYGSQKGWCVSQTKDAWSVADLFDEALGVTVRTN